MLIFLIFPIILNTEIHKIIIKVNKKWLQEERKKQQEEEQREKKEEGDAKNKGIYSLVIKLDRDGSVEIVTLGSIESPKAIFTLFLLLYPFTGDVLNFFSTFSTILNR